VNAHVGCQLGVERCRHHSSLTDENGNPTMLREHLDPFANPFHTRGPDEHRMELVGESCDAQVALEAVDLATVCIAAHSMSRAAKDRWSGRAS
jgi:hypothetical protein